MKFIKNYIPMLLFLIITCVHLSIMNDYGLTWDFHHHFFAGGWFLGMKYQELEPRALPYLPPDPRETVILPYGPFVQIIPTLSWIVLYQKLHLLPYDSAYHLPIILVGIAGIFFLYTFLKEGFDRKTAVIGSIFLFLTPRFFSDLHNDMKDIPSASIFALNMLLLYRFVKKQTVTNLIFASLGFMVAFNIKVNAIFIPIIYCMYIFLISFHTFITASSKKYAWEKILRKLPIQLSYCILAPLLAFILWSMFWGDGIGQIKLMFITFGIGTNNLEVILHGKTYYSGVNVPWYYAPWYIGITTPLSILLFFLVGMVVSMKKWLTKNNTASLLLLLWCTVPLLRYLSPKTGVLDGVRHFEEVLIPIAGLAAVGASLVIQHIGHQHIPSVFRRFLVGTLSLLVCVSLAVPIITYHPYQITYFNELVGGIWGASGNYDLDYWGGSQKYAIEWLNANAPKNASVNIVMAGNVGSVHLRDDLLRTVNQKDFLHADYVVVLNRMGFFTRYRVNGTVMIGDYIRTHTPIHTVYNQGIPLVWVYRNSL